jgi:hypothetical protein
MCHIPARPSVGVGSAGLGSESKNERTTVRTIRHLILVLAVAALAATVVSTANAAKKPKPKKKVPIAFVGNYAGQASTLVNGTTVTISAKGNGKGSLIGSGALNASGTGDSSQQPCVPFGGTGSITGAHGTINFAATPGASGCGDEGGHNFTVKAILKVTSATGKLAGRKGTLRAIGTYSRDDGTFTVKVTGNLTK